MFTNLKLKINKYLDENDRNILFIVHGLESLQKQTMKLETIFVNGLKNGPLQQYTHTLWTIKPIINKFLV